MKLIEDKDEVKKLLTLALKKFDEICSENNLRYSIDYGTLIGAVRHKGFIPWDDDIDVSMPREDYEKLLSLQYNDGRYEVKSYRYSKNYHYVFSKFSDNSTLIEEVNRDGQELGLNIDIFPCDLVSEKKYYKLNKLYDKTVPNLVKIYGRFGPNCEIPNSELSFKKILSKYAHKAVLPITNKFLYNFEKAFISTKGDYYIFFFHNFTGIKNSFKKSFFDDLTRLQFEDLSISAYKDYDYRLKNIYGDYMTIPPENERGSHRFKAYYL